MTLTHPAAIGPQNAASRRTRSVGIWIVQLALAAQFTAGGLLKVTGSTEMIDMFTHIGAGQWLRYVVGVLELAGAIGLLVPRLSVPAALGLVGLMVGATTTNVIVLGTSPVLPVAFLLLSGLVARARWAHSEPGRLHPLTTL